MRILILCFMFWPIMASAATIHDMDRPTIPLMNAQSPLWPATAPPASPVLFQLALPAPDPDPHLPLPERHQLSATALLALAEAEVGFPPRPPSAFELWIAILLCLLLSLCILLAEQESRQPGWQRPRASHRPLPG